MAPGRRLTLLAAVGCLAGAGLAEVLAILLHSPAFALGALGAEAAGFLLLAGGGLDAALVALVVVVPVLTVELGLGDAGKTVSSDKLALAVLGGAWWVRRAGAAAGDLLRVPAVWFWIAYLAVCGLSALRVGVSLRETWSVAEQAAYATVFWLALDVFRSPSALRRVLLAASVGAALVAALGVVEGAVNLVLERPLPLYFKQAVMPSHYSFGSTVAHTNFLGAYLVLMAPVLVALALVHRAPWRPIMLVGAGLVGTVIVHARSIGALAGLLAAATLLVTFGRPPRALPRAVRAGVVAALVVLALGAGAVIAAKLGQNPQPIGVRIATLRIGLVVLAEHPLLGGGAGAYTDRSGSIERALYGRELTEYHREGDVMSAHDGYLDIAAERGVLGLAAVLAVLAAVLVPGLTGAVRRRDGSERLLAAAAVAGLVGFALQALTENLFQYSKVAMMFWIMAAALVRLAAPPTTEG